MAKSAGQSSFFTLAAILLPVSLIAVAGMLWYEYRQSPPDAAIAISAESLPLHAQSALRGDSEALDRLAAALDTIPAGLGGDVATLRAEAGELLQQADAVRSGNAAIAELDSALPALVSLAQDFYDQTGNSAAVDRLVTRLEDIRLRVPALRGDAVSIPGVAAEMTRARDEAASILAAFAGDDTGLDIAALGPGAAGLLDGFRGRFTGVDQQVDAVVANAPGLAAARRLTDSMTAAAEGLSPAAGALGGGFAALMPWLPLGLLGVALLLVLALLTSYLRDSHLRRAAIEQADQNERNQQAILRLLDELGSLADGDLTVEATVTEDITGAIADSINYAIEALRDLVKTIDDTAVLVDSATRQTETTAVHMNRAAQKQALEIAAATESIAAIAASIEEVSGNAERSSDVARHSVDVAHKGGDAVRRTIEGMNTIRETIQETSKRIKRLGESSQEIGNIVELINDIAEQTNILALNASIQASMAGEAGRGFAVVADEVQRLAERSTNATKQIEVLVRTIQADTNEAVVSMERSTTDVVGGALLAENAGAALDEIEQVSNQIASLVQNIYGSARQQSKVAQDINRRTAALKEISQQTGSATSKTTSSIAKLAELAGQLRKSVSGFRLPEKGNVTEIPVAKPPTRGNTRAAG
jgi:twitching motility protein PilJ